MPPIQYVAVMGCLLESLEEPDQRQRPADQGHDDRDEKYVHGISSLKQYAMPVRKESIVSPLRAR